MLLLLLSFYGALSALILTAISGYYFTQSSKGRLLVKESLISLLTGKESKERLAGAFGDLNFENEVEGIIDEKLDDLVLVFKRQIPMASTFLVGPLADKLKGSAKEEILKIVPEMKERFLKQMESDQKHDTLADKILDSLSWGLFRPIALRLCMLAVGIGAIMGLIQAAWMYLFGFI